MLGRILVLTLFGGLMWAQTDSGATESGVPEYVLYDSFFYRVALIEDGADRNLAAGVDDRTARETTRREFHLSSEHEAAVKRAALSWRERNNEVVGEARALRERPSEPSVAQRLQQLAEERKQNVLRHVADVRAAMGEEVFRRFDQQVRSSSRLRGPGIAPRLDEMGQVAPPPSSSASGRLPVVFARVSRSEYVVVGRVTAHDLRSRTFPALTRPDGKVEVPVPKHTGVVFTVQVTEVLCRESDFVPELGPAPPVGETVHMFVPWIRGAGRPSELYPRMTAYENLVPGKDYLLYLDRFPDQGALVESEVLDPAFTYFRAFDGASGARLLDTGRSYPAAQYAAQEAASVRGLCEAASAADVGEKIARLEALRGSVPVEMLSNIDAAILHFRRVRGRAEAGGPVRR